MCIPHIVAPNEVILREGWDSWSKDARAFCQKNIRKAEVTMPTGYNDMTHYWRQYIAPMINYCMGNKRNNLHQIVKRIWMSDAHSSSGAPKATVISKFERIINTQNVTAFFNADKVNDWYLEYVHRYLLGAANRKAAEI